MATPGDTISIESVTALNSSGRFNTIKFTFAGVATLATVRMWDSTEPTHGIISELHNVESGVEYAIETGERVDTATFKFFPLPPAPVHIIDFIPLGEDLTDHTAIITDIKVGTRISNGSNIVLIEVTDSRVFDDTTQTIQGGDPSEWPRDQDTGMYIASNYISPNNMSNIQGYVNTGELMPIIGVDEGKQRLNIGMLTHELFKRFSGVQ